MGVIEPERDLADDVTELFRQAGRLILRREARIDARFDRLEADVAGLKTDVGGLKTDVAGLKTEMAETKAQLGRLERSTESRFNRVDAQLERLIGLIQRAETGRT